MFINFQERLIYEGLHVYHAKINFLTKIKARGEFGIHEVARCSNQALSSRMIGARLSSYPMLKCIGR